MKRNLPYWKVPPFAVFALLTVIAGSGCPLLAQSSNDETGQNAGSFKKVITTTLSANYLLYLPDGYANSEEPWPLILFLHGAGERGEDLALVEMHGPPQARCERRKGVPICHPLSSVSRR
ncbi:MAG: hypothetical protein JJT96_15855 [Opitutales bacterium]|nr:hypothetical protein [Opitutales bacterium]